MNLSPAGSWYIIVSLPIVLYIILRWVWLQLVWLRFLSVTSRMDLQLIASHPDRAGGPVSWSTACEGTFPSDLQSE